MSNEYERVSDGTAAGDHLYTRKVDGMFTEADLRAKFEGIVANLGDVVHRQEPAWAARLYDIFTEHATGGRDKP